MVAGLGLTLSLRDIGRAFLRARPLALGIGTQLVATPLAGFLIWRTAGPSSESVGLVIQAVAPIEITAPLMAALAGGGLSLSISVMAVSLFLAPVTMPLLLRLVLGRGVEIPVGPLFLSLALTVALPLAIGSAVFTGLGRPALLRRLGPGLSALMVVVLIFVVAGNASGGLELADRGGILLMAAGATVLLGVGFGSGWAVGRAARLDTAAARSLIFTTGMREFGVAAAVALTFFDARAAVFPAVYGVIMMLTSAWIAGKLRVPESAEQHSGS